MTILVAGSAHLDILARASHRDDVRDRVGEVSIEVGGTACNIAVGLARSGARVRLLSAMNDSVYSTVIGEYLTDMGVELAIECRKDLPSGGFSAHVDTRGELVSAVSCMPVEQVAFDWQAIGRAMEGASAAVIDCNLSALAIGRLVAAANELMVPVYVAAVSEEKSLRMNAIAGQVKAVFLNLDEYRFFCQEVLGRLMDPSEAATVIGTTLVVMEGSDGVVLAKPGVEAVRVPPPVFDRAGAGNRLGMGDAMTAGIVMLHELRGLSLEDAAQGALEMVSEVAVSRHCTAAAAPVFETAIERVRRDAAHDPLTGALNRRSSERELKRMLDRRHDRGDTVCVLLLDIDRFKQINDTRGHSVGDEIIVSVTKAIQRCLREGDFVGRWGGDEFLVVLPHTECANALTVAERIRQAVEGSVTPLQVTVSIGCAEAAGPSAEDLRDLVERADQALYEAKRAGRNRVASAGEAMCVHSSARQTGAFRIAPTA